MAVLGSMLLSARATDTCVSMLAVDDFYRPAHQTLFGVMRGLCVRGVEIDYLTLKDTLVQSDALDNVGGEAYLVHVAEFVPSPANAEYYADIVLGLSRIRRMRKAMQSALNLLVDPEAGTPEERIEKAEGAIFDVGKGSAQSYFQGVSELADEYLSVVSKVHGTGRPLKGLTVGFDALDDVTTGFGPGDFVVIGARPGIGKTALVLDFALNVARQIAMQETRGSVAFFSLEMSSAQLMSRMASMMAGISSKRLKQDWRLSDEEYVALSDSASMISDLPIYIDDRTDLTSTDMRAKCRRLKQDKGLSLIILDYLQLMKGTRKFENRVNEVAEFARSCKRLAKELGVPLIALAQLSRQVENRAGPKKPQLSDLRDSGSIEADADIVLLLNRKEGQADADELKRNPNHVQEVEVDVAKNRHGETRTIRLGFQPSYTRYRNVDQDAWS